MTVQTKGQHNARMVRLVPSSGNDLALIVIN